MSAIKEKYPSKTGHIFRKKAGKKDKSCLLRYASPNKDYFKDLEQKSHLYEQKIILKELKRLTSLVEKLNRKIINPVRKMVDGENTKDYTK